MTLSIGQLGDGFEKSLRKARESLEERLTSETSTHRHGMSWSFHWGAPRPDSLPNDPVAVWLMPQQVRDDPDAPFRSNYFIVTWRLSVVVRDGGNDPYGFDQTTADQAVGAVIEALTESNAAVSLDSSVDFTSDFNASFAIASVAAGDALVGEWVVTFGARHSLEYRS